MPRSKEQDLYRTVVKPLIEAIDKTAMTMCGYSTTPEAIIQRKRHEQTSKTEMPKYKRRSKKAGLHMDQGTADFIKNLRSVFNE
jgi:hypothetical protein